MTKQRKDEIRWDEVEKEATESMIATAKAIKKAEEERKIIMI